MTLEEAIQRCKKKACDNPQHTAEYEQLAYWLSELKEFKDLSNNADLSHEIYEIQKKFMVVDEYEGYYRPCYAHDIEWIAKHFIEWQLSQEQLQKLASTSYENGYKQAIKDKDKNSIPGYVARDKDGSLYLHFNITYRGPSFWAHTGPILPLKSDMFPKQTWENNPLKVKLIFC
jgi:hypothetical protein